MKLHNCGLLSASFVLATSWCSARADDAPRLTPFGEASFKTMELKGDASVQEVRGRGGYGGYRGGYGGYRGGYGGYGYRGYGYGGYGYGGYGYGGYYGGYGLGYGYPYYYSSYPYYGYGYGGYSPYYGGYGLGYGGGYGRGYRMGLTLSPMGESTGTADGTYNYDGGPANLVPVPSGGASPAPQRQTIPTGNLLVSLPRDSSGGSSSIFSFTSDSASSTPAASTQSPARVVYPAYGEPR